MSPAHRRLTARPRGGGRPPNAACSGVALGSGTSYEWLRLSLRARRASGLNVWNRSLPSVDRGQDSGASLAIDLEHATDRIYEAAVLPDRWPGVLDTLADIAGAVGTVLIADDMENLRLLNSASLDWVVDDFRAGGWAGENARTLKLIAADHAGFLIEEDVYSAEELEQDVLIHDFLRPRGLGWATATAFPMPTDDVLVFSAERRYADGPVPRDAVRTLDRLRPHLGRASLLSARLLQERARATVDTLALLGLPAGILSFGGRLRSANDLLQAMVPGIVRDGRERVALADQAADAMLVRALSAAVGRAPQSLPIRATESEPAMVAHLVPVRGDARDIFANCPFMLVITPLRPSRLPGASLLRGLFDLTAAEARIVRGIAAGKSVSELAQQHGVGKETVRSQIKSVFAKTGVHRQVELVRLVSGLSLIP